MRTGRTRWTAKVGQWSLEDLSEASCESENLQLTSEGLLTATANHGVQLLDLATGRPRWTVTGWAPPVALSGDVLVMGRDPEDQGFGAAQPSASYIALDTRTGRTLWTRQCAGEDVVVTPQRFVCANGEGVGDVHATLRVWVRSLRSGDVRWVTPGTPQWAGGDAPQFSAGDDWLMTFRVVREQDRGFDAQVRIYR